MTPKQITIMSVVKKYIDAKKVCRVRFTLPSDLGKSISRASVVGDFNNWDPIGNPMKMTKDGHFSLSIDLPIEKEYQFRYLLDGSKWVTDFEADGLSSIPWSDEQNSVVRL